MSDVRAEKIEWLWPKRVPLGKVTLIVGDPGKGKSLVTLDMAARMSRGKPWPDEPKKKQPVRSSVLLSGEDDVADTIRPRLDKANADCTKINLIRAVQERDGKRYFDLSRDIPLFRDAIDSVRNCGLLVIDPVSAYMGGADSNKNSDVRAVLTPLADLAAEKRVAIVLVTHMRKDEGAAMYRSMGSLGFVAAARAAWLVCDDPADKSRRLFLRMKSNLAPGSGDGLSFAVKSSGPNELPFLEWSPEPVSISADEALVPGKKKRGPKATERDKAIFFLKDKLKVGPLPAKQLIANAEDLGIKQRTLQRAFDELDGRPKRRGFGGEVTWSLPCTKPVTKAPAPKNLSSMRKRVTNGKTPRNKSGPKPKK